MNDMDNPGLTATSGVGGECVEAYGADVETAISRALAELGIERDRAAIEVLNEATMAVPGERLSAKDACVRVSALDGRTARALSLVNELLVWMNIPARVSVRLAAASTRIVSALPPLIIDVAGDDLGLLIGWRGETLRAMQTVVNLMLDATDTSADEVEKRRVIIDVERYRARREEHVRELALRLADRVKRSGERYTLDPMHAYERRIVHITLEGDAGVRTESSGQEPARRIIIHPTGSSEAGAEPAGRRSWNNR